MTTSWNDEEEDALQGLPLEAQLLYLRGLRRFMDYRTGLVGVHRRVSWQGLSETLEVEHQQGMAGQRFDKSKLRRLAKWLEKKRLVEQRNDGRYLVFRLPLADTDESVQKKAAPRPHHVRTTQAAPRPRHQEASKISGLDEGAAEGHPVPAPIEGQKAAPHPESVIRNKKKENKQRKKTADRFDEFWAVYPKHVGKKPCIEKWTTRDLDGTADAIIADIQRRCVEDRTWLDGYVPNPLTYINQNRWEDEIQPTHGSSNANRSREQRRNEISDAIANGAREAVSQLGGDVVREVPGDLRITVDGQLPEPRNIGSRKG